MTAQPKPKSRFDLSEWGERDGKINFLIKNIHRFPSIKCWFFKIDNALVFKKNLEFTI